MAMKEEKAGSLIHLLTLFTDVLVVAHRRKSSAVKRSGPWTAPSTLTPLDQSAHRKPPVIVAT